MKYHSDRRSFISRYALKGICAGVLLGSIFFWDTARSALYTVIEKPLVFLSSAANVVGSGGGSVRTMFTDKKEYEARIHELEATIELLENEITYQPAPPETDHKVLSMNMIIKDVTGLYGSLLLSKGFVDGVEEGSLVYIRGKQAVCRITDVHSKTSLCVLLSHEKEVPAMTASSSIMLLLQGDGGGSFTATLPKGSPITIGEQVLLRERTEYTLGTVVDIRDEVEDVFTRVYVRGAYNPLTSALFYLDK